MCNRYQPGERKRITDFFDAHVLREVNAGPTIVHPREPGWVVRMVDHAPVLEQMTWGFRCNSGERQATRRNRNR